MSSDWWLNRIGTAAAVTTPRGTVPQYGMAFDVGNAPWTNQTQFNTWVEDATAQHQTPDIQRIQQAKDEDKGWFQRLTGAVGSGITRSIGWAGETTLNLFGDDNGAYDNYARITEDPISRDEFESMDAAERQRLLGGTSLGQVADAPPIKQAIQTYNFVTNVAETPFIASTNAYQDGRGWWLSKSSLARAWREADERTPAQAVADWFIVSAPGNNDMSDRDLDRIRRTNSLYGLTTFAGDLFVGFKLDPTVLGAKGLGEVQSIRRGIVPIQGKVGAEALRTAQGQAPYRGLDPARRYGTWRGQRIVNNFDDLRDLARTSTLSDLTAHSMFRRTAVNGPQAALAFKVAANDDRLWDLTQRAILSDPKAWAEIRAMQDSPGPLADYAGADAQTWLDAVNATKTKAARLDSEIKDIEKRIAQGPDPDSLPGYWDYYSKELHADAAKRQADLDEITGVLAKYDDYNTWLETWGTSADNLVGPVNVSQVSTRPPTLNILSQRTYQKNLYGKVHTATGISRAGWLREANPFDLHRSDAGIASIRRQFEQFKHFYGYADPAALESITERFTRAIATQNHRAAFEIAREVEDVHHIRAAAQHFGLDEDAVRLFMDQTKLRRNEMAEALLRGDGALYTTAPNPGVKVISRDGGVATIHVTEGDRVHKIRIPEEQLESLRVSNVDPSMPQDPTQTANYYTPMNTRQVYLAIKRDPSLFRELESDIRNRGREAAAAALNGVDAVGTKWNQMWKPLQLFRLAWPQRVLMDEGLRGMAMLGMGPWLRQYGDSFTKATMNAVNPLEHATLSGGAGFGAGFLAGGAVGGPIGAITGGAIGAAVGTKLAPTAFLRRRDLKIGPGPLADEVTGKSYRIPRHEEQLRTAPTVPVSLVPRVDPKRADALAGTIEGWKADRAFRDQRSVMIQARGEEMGLRFPERPTISKLHTSIQSLRAGWTGERNASVIDAVTGRVSNSGYVVPVATRTTPLHAANSREALNDIEDFVTDNRELLAAGGYRLMVKQEGDQLSLNVVRHFGGKRPKEAAEFAQQVDADGFMDLNDGHMEYAREWIHPARVDESEPAEMADLANELNDETLMSRFFALADSEVVQKVFRRREFGRGTATFKSHDGRKVEARDAFDGSGEPYTYLISSSPVFARLTDSYQRTLSMMREKAVGYKRMLPPDMTPAGLRTRAGRTAAAEYYAAWSDILNDQIRNSPIWFRMLDGKTDDEIIDWLRNTAEGASLRRTLPHKGYNPERWVEEHRQALDFYLPRTDLQALLRERKLRPSELRSIVREDMPEVFGPDVEMVHGGIGWGKRIGALTDRIYHALGTVPSDVLSRQPFFRGMYQMKMRNLLAATDAEVLTPAVMRGYEKVAREYALRQVRRTMYDLMDDTNFTQAVRFLSPFWGAQQEAIVKWMTIAAEKPETVARFYVGLNQAYDRMMIVDEDGNPVKDAKGLLDYDPNHRVILQIPKNLTKVAPFDKMLGEFGSVGVSFGAANTALQGDNFLMPSLGPIVAIPADQAARMMWDTYGTRYDDNFFYKWLFPIGRSGGGISGAMEQIVPGWSRRILAWQKGLGSRMYNNTYWSVQREMELDHKKRGLPAPTPDEIQKAVDWHMGLRVMASFGLPAQMEFRPKHQYFLDAYHEMVRQYGPGQAFEKFVEKYGADAARYAASSSTSIGIPSTSKGMGEFEENRDLIQKYTDWTDAIIAPDAWADDFSSDAYGAQFDISVGGGSNKKLRELSDPKERARLTDVRLGWLQYRQFMAGITSELYARGLTSLEQTEAAQLKAVKDQWVAQKRQENPAWSDDMDSFSNTIYGRVRDLRQFAYDKRFDNRPDFQGVRQYLMIRDAVAANLDNYAATTGGSRNLQAQENTALRTWFYQQVGQLVQDNPAFGEFYTRYLETDRLERGSGP